MYFFKYETYQKFQTLEQKISDFHKREDAILYASCFDANAGIFESLLTAEDAIFSDTLNHASIIDGIRLCKAKKFRYKHRDMEGTIFSQITIHLLNQILILITFRRIGVVTAKQRCKVETDSHRRSIFDGWNDCTAQENRRARPKV